MEKLAAELVVPWPMVKLQAHDRYLCWISSLRPTDQIQKLN